MTSWAEVVLPVQTAGGSLSLSPARSKYHLSLSLDNPATNNRRAGSLPRGPLKREGPSPPRGPTGGPAALAGRQTSFALGRPVPASSVACEPVSGPRTRPFLSFASGRIA